MPYYLKPLYEVMLYNPVSVNLRLAGAVTLQVYFTAENDINILLAFLLSRWGITLCVVADYTGSCHL